VHEHRSDPVRSLAIGRLEKNPHDDLFAVHEKAQRALKDVGHLLALVRVDRHERTALQVDLRQHLALAGDDLPREHLGDLFERDLVPAMQPDNGRLHGFDEHIPLR